MPFEGLGSNQHLVLDCGRRSPNMSLTRHHSIVRGLEMGIFEKTNGRCEVLDSSLSSIFRRLTCILA